MTLNELKSDRPHWSYSSLNQLLNICSLQYYFEKILKLKRKTVSAAISFGSAFHRVMEHVNLIRLGGKTPSSKDASDLFTDVFARQLKEEDVMVVFGEDESTDSLSEQGRGAVKCMVDAIDPDERVVAINQAFCVPVKNQYGKTMELPLIGEQDLIVEKDGKTEIVDYKTSCRRYSQGQIDKSLQPVIYQYAFNQIHGGDIPAFRFDIAIKNKTPVMQQLRTSRTQHQLKFDRLAKLVDAAERILKAKLFVPAEQSYYCAGCPFSAECAKW